MLILLGSLFYLDDGGDILPKHSSTFIGLPSFISEKTTVQTDGCHKYNIRLRTLQAALGPRVYSASNRNEY
jgi:hypothetical protein